MGRELLPTLQRARAALAPQIKYTLHDTADQVAARELQYLAENRVTDGQTSRLTTGRHRLCGPESALRGATLVFLVCAEVLPEQRATACERFFVNRAE